MDQKEIKKNKLDLEYKKYLQILNGLFLVLTSGAFGIIASSIYSNNKENLLSGLSISAIILIIIFILIKNTNKRMNEILEEVEDL